MVTTPYVYVTVGACLLGTCLNSVTTTQKQRLTEHRWRLKAKGKGCGGESICEGSRSRIIIHLHLRFLSAWHYSLPKVDGDPAKRKLPRSCHRPYTQTNLSLSLWLISSRMQSPVGWTTNLIVTGLWSFSGKSYDQWNFKKPDHVKQHSYNPWSRIFILIFFFCRWPSSGKHRGF